MLDKLKHCCQNISSTISLKAASHNVPDSSRQKKVKTAQSIWTTIWSWTPETVGGLSDAAPMLLGGLRYVSGSFDTFTNAVCFYISVSLKTRAFRRNPATETSVPSHEFTRELLWNIKERAHEKGITDEYHLAKSQFNKRLKHTESQHRTWEERVSLPSVTQAENSPSDTPLPDTCQWHLITSTLPSASLLHHLDWLPSHRWLCWTNLESPRPYAASPMGTWYKKTSLTVHLQSDCSYLSYSVSVTDWCA